MKGRYAFLLLGVAALAAGAGWWAGRQQGHAAHAASTTDGRKILFYQSAMHPWIKSDKPGNCTICGMPLTPVFEGQKSLELGADLIVLGSSSITVAGVTTEPATRKKLEKTLRVAGTLDDDDSRHRRLSAYIDGRIEELYVPSTGAEVIEGQPLATFHSLPLLALEREYLAIVKQLKLAPEGTRGELEHLRQGAANRLLLMGLTKRQVEALPARPEDAHLTDILAPISGTVVTREVYAGQYVKEGDKLFELADFATMWFKFDVYERDLPWLKLGQPVDITTPSTPGKVYRASIRFIDPNLSDATRTAKVRVEVPNPLIEENGHQRRELRHRLYAEGVVNLSLPETLTIPRTAVLNPNGQPVVYVDQGNGRYQQRKVKLGRLGDLTWEVLEGIEEGEKVVVTGNLLLDSQAQLNAGNSAPSADTAKPTASATVPANRTLPPGSEAAAQAFLIAVSDVTSALASDDVERFNQQAPRVMETFAPLERSLASQTGWGEFVAVVHRTAHWERTIELETARKSFAPLSAAVAEFLKSIRGQPGFGTYKLFQCPMTSKSFPGAPKVGLWIQKEGSIRNPYFGAEMLDCGTEVKP